MRLLFENPWPMVIIGGLLTAMLTGGLLRTGASLYCGPSWV